MGQAEGKSLVRAAPELEREAGAPVSRRPRRAGAALRRSPAAAAGALILVGLAVVALAAPVLSPHPPDAQHPARALQPPSAEHWFGTDLLGRDLFSRVVHGARIELAVVVAVSLLSLATGTLVGVCSGFLGGWADDLLMRVTDVFLAFPTLVLAMAFAAALGPGLPQTVLALALVGWAPYARVARGEALHGRSQAFVEAARAAGAPPARVILHHILPQAVPVLLVQASLRTGSLVLTLAGLGFLGLGPPPPTPEWGALVSEGRTYLVDQWWLSTFPGLAIALMVLGFNLLGEGVRDLLDPRRR